MSLIALSSSIDCGYCAQRSGSKEIDSHVSNPTCKEHGVPHEVQMCAVTEIETLQRLGVSELGAPVFSQ